MTRERVWISRNAEMGALALGMFLGGVAAAAIHLVFMPVGAYAGAVVAGLLVERLRVRGGQA